MKTFSSTVIRFIFLGIWWVSLVGLSRGQVEMILHNFADGSVANDGRSPSSPLVLGTDGNLYGMTQAGTGTASSGAIFKITPTGVLTILHRFKDGTVTNDGSLPCGSLLLGEDGNFYGMTQTGGSASAGVVFKMTPQGTVTILHSFNDNSVSEDGQLPLAGLVQGPDGNFYGTTSMGGSASKGTAFVITPQGAVTILHAFGDGSVTSDGANPRCNLIEGSDGNFYGTTRNGGTSGGGVFFEMTPQGSVTLLHSFGATSQDGLQPYAAAVQGFDGNFYGTTTIGGPFGKGILFKTTPGQVTTILRTFGDSSVYNDGNTPDAGLLLAADGNFYGDTQLGGGAANDGCLFRLTPQGQFSILHSFGDGTVTGDGTKPQAALTQGPNGIIYGVTFQGGTAGFGTVFALNPNAILVSSPAAASGSVSLPFTYQIIASQNPTSYAATNLPDGLSLDTTTGLISGTPTTVETNVVTLTVTNASGSATFSLTITIGGVPVPSITSGLISYGSVGAAFTYDIVATNPGSITGYSATNLPDGLSLNSTTGVISGMPTTVGTSSVTLTATNATGPSASVTLSIQILAAPPMLSDEYGIFHAFEDGTVSHDVGGPRSILQAFDGNFYGIAVIGGTGNYGGIFKITPQGVTSTFFTFPSTTEVSSPNSLVQAADGTFYGTTQSQIFKVTLAGQLTLLHTFPSGTTTVVNPLIQGFDGSLYGTDSNNGTGGEVFKITPQGVFTSLHTFLSTGLQPRVPGPLIQGSDGNFYGVTSLGGMEGTGTIFQMTPQGTVTILHNFHDGSTAGDGENPQGALVQGSDGNFYGVTTAGGVGALGTIYVSTPQGMVTTLHAFGDGSVPNDGNDANGGLIQGLDGNFYGTTSSGGTGDNGDGGIIFEITPQGAYTVLHDFGTPNRSIDGDNVTTPLIQSAEGDFYGVTQGGGAGSAGTVYTIQAKQTPVHVPIYFGAAYQVSPEFGPLSFTPKAIFGVSGSGVETGDMVKPQANGGSVMTALASLLPQTILKFFSATNWTLDGTLPNFLTFDPTSGTISGTPVQSGTFTFTMTPHNAIGDGMPMTVTLFIDVPPGFNSPATVNAMTGTPFSYQITTSPPADSYGATGLPGWLAADPVSGIISGTPPAAGTYAFNALATNVSGQTAQPVLLTVTGGASGVPAITSATTAAASLGASFSYQIATSPGATSYSALGLPTGLVFNAASGSIMGTPSALGVFQVPLSATNASGSYSSVLSLTIAQPMPPTITSALTVTAAENAPFSYQITVTGNVTSYSTSTLPNGLQFDSSTGLISGTPTATGSFPITLTVGNPSGMSMETLNLSVETPMNFSEWENGFGVTGQPTDISGNDGIPNLLKYVFDVSPVGPTPPTQRIVLPTLGSTTTVGGVTYLTLTYRQYALLSEVTLNVQTSSDLQNWTTVNPPDFSQKVGTDATTGDPIMQVGVRATGTRQFIRLDVTSP